MRVVFAPIYYFIFAVGKQVCQHCEAANVVKNRLRKQNGCLLRLIGDKAYDSEDLPCTSPPVNRIAMRGPLASVTA